MSNDHSVPRESLSGNRPKTLGLYIVGYLASLLLTLLAFSCVHYEVFSETILVASITVFAFIQTLVQIFCFLRLNIASDKARWNLTAFLFTVLVIIVIVAGTLWIMANLNYRMVH